MNVEIRQAVVLQAVSDSRCRPALTPGMRIGVVPTNAVGSQWYWLLAVGGTPSFDRYLTNDDIRILSPLELLGEVAE